MGLSWERMNRGRKLSQENKRQRTPKKVPISGPRAVSARKGERVITTGRLSIFSHLRSPRVLFWKVGRWPKPATVSSLGASPFSRATGKKAHCRRLETAV